MTREHYESIKARITAIVDDAELRRDYTAIGLGVSPNATFYRLDLTGISDELPAFVHPMTSKNLWNVAERFYSLMVGLGINAD